MPVPRVSVLRMVGLAVLGAAAVAACRGETSTPAIGFTYNFGDTAFAAFLTEELERTRAPDGKVIRVVGIRTAAQHSATSALSAEVIRATELAADPDVIVSVGPGGSREALQVAPVYRGAGLPNIVPTGTSRLLAGAGPYMHLLAANDSVQGDFIGVFADSVLHARSAAIVHVPDEYGAGLAAGTAVAFAARGIRLLDRIVMPLTRDCIVPDDAATHEAITSEVALRGTPDVVVLAMRTIEAACLAASLHRRFPGAALIAGDGVYLERSFVDRAGLAASGIYLVAFWHPNVEFRGSRELVRRFETRVHRRVRHGDAMFFDGVMLAAAAIRSAGARRELVQAYLVEVGDAQPAYEGVTGRISFAPGRPRGLLMTRVSGDTSVVVAR